MVASTASRAITAAQLIAATTHGTRHHCNHGPDDRNAMTQRPVPFDIAARSGPDDERKSFCSIGTDAQVRASTNR
jgi:hypothetical protein